jgi:hypothetical protein
MALPINTPAQAALFSDKTVENCLQTYFNKTYSIKLNFELTTDNSSRRIVKIVGQQNSISAALEDLLTLMTLFRTRTFKDINGQKPFSLFYQITIIVLDIDWLKIKDATLVIQHQMNRRNTICICQQQTSPISILVHHIDKGHNKLGVDEQIIDSLCRQQLIVTTCKPIVPGNEWITLKNDILKRSDYGKDICLLDEQQIITLYGLPHVVKDVQQQFTTINQKAIEKLYNTPSVVRNDSIKSEKPRESTVENAPKARESIISPKSTEITTSKSPTHSIMFDVDEPGFEVLINQGFQRLSAIVDSNCSLVKQIVHHQIQIPIPKAKVYEFDDNQNEVQSPDNNVQPLHDSQEASTDQNTNWLFGLFQWKKPKTRSPKSAVQMPTTPIDTTPMRSVSIGKSKIIVCTGDLKNQAVRFFSQWLFHSFLFKTLT